MTDLDDDLAERNLAAVRGLFVALSTAQHDAGLTTDAVASLMGLRPGDVEAAIGGYTDLTLSDLQELALALDVRLGFTVHPNS